MSNFFIIPFAMVFCCCSRIHNEPKKSQEPMNLFNFSLMKVAQESGDSLYFDSLINHLDQTCDPEIFTACSRELVSYLHCYVIQFDYLNPMAGTYPSVSLDMDSLTFKVNRQNIINGLKCFRKSKWFLKQDSVPQEKIVQFRSSYWEKGRILEIREWDNILDSINMMDVRH